MANFVHSIPLLAFIFPMLLNTVHSTDSLSFSFSWFAPEDVEDLILQGDAHIPSGNNALQLTHIVKNTVGRALYTAPVHLWERSSLRVATFESNFTFALQSVSGERQPADGITFFIAPTNTTIPTGSDSYGGLLGLFSPENALNTSANQVVAVEFDTFHNTWDPKDSHFAILVNSIKSDAYKPFERKELERVSVRITYTPPHQHNDGVLNASYSYPPNTEFSTISLPVNLNTLLPEFVRIGFSASTGDDFQTHFVESWSFSSRLINHSNAKEDDAMYNIVRHE